MGIDVYLASTRENIKGKIWSWWIHFIKRRLKNCSLINSLRAYNWRKVSLCILFINNAKNRYFYKLDAKLTRLNEVLRYILIWYKAICFNNWNRVNSYCSYFIWWKICFSLKIKQIISLLKVFKNSSSLSPVNFIRKTRKNSWSERIKERYSFENLIVKTLRFLRENEASFQIKRNLFNFKIRIKGWIEKKFFKYFTPLLKRQNDLIRN